MTRIRDFIGEGALPFSKYMLRPSMIEGESLLGYVIRFCMVNRVQRQFLLTQLIRLLYIGHKTEVEGYFEQVQELIGAHNQLDKKWLVSTRYKISTRHHNAGVWKLFSTNNLRFCPQCLRKNQYHFHCWTMPLFNVCPIHQTQLLTTCSRCESKLIWLYLNDGWLCKCGMCIEHMAVKKSPGWQLRLSQMIIGASDIDIPEVYKTQYDQIDRIESYSLVDIYTAIHWAALLRHTIKQGWLSMRDISEYPPMEKTNYSRVGAWEINLVFNSEAQYLKLRRLFKFRTRRKPHVEMIISIHRMFGDIEQIMLKIGQSDSPFSRGIANEFCKLKAQYKIPTLFEELNEYFEGLTDEDRFKYLKK